MIRSDPKAIAELVAAIYRSAYEPSEWRDALELLRLALGGSRACFVRLGPDMRADDTVATASDPDFDRAFAVDERLNSTEFSRAVDRMPLGPVVRHEEIWDRESLHRSALWNEFLAPQEIHSGLMTKAFATGSSYWFVDVSRSRRQDTFSESDRALIGMLTPHLRRATEIGRALEMERRSFDTRAWLGGAIGLATVDSERRISVLDAAADAVLSRPGCGITRRAGRLDVRGAGAARFADLVRQACRTGGEPDRAAGGGDMVAPADFGIDGSVDVLLSIGPALKPGRAAFHAEPGAVIAMRELSPHLPSGFAAAAARAFSLTEREAGIATQLAAGRSLQEAAHAAGIAVSTARWYLDQVYGKTGTRQQSALVALLRTIEPFVPGD